MRTVANLYLFGLPTDYYKGLAHRVGPFTAGEVRTIAAKYITPKTLKIVAVGDRAKIEPQLKKLKLGKTTVRKADGTLVKPKGG